MLNYDVSSLYPNIVRIYGYSSRAQADKESYIKLLDMRMKAKHNELPESFLNPLGLTNKDLKNALKLVINSYTGTLRAPFNDLCDWKQGVGICFTGQLLILQLAYDLSQIPTVELAEANTDAICFYIDEEYKEQAIKVLDDWQTLTGLELEEDNIVRYIARDVNNYVEIVQTGDNYYEVHYKGGLFTGEHSFNWNKDKRIFEYTFNDDLKSNSLTICSEAILKNLLFNIPVEETIEKCNDPFRFQMITHLGGTYKKMVLEYPDGNQEELQRNNRIYAGLEPSGKIFKIKEDGRKDSLAMCPVNPIVDNGNEITIEKINKMWYIKYTKQKINDFKKGREVYMEEKLDKLKKDELISLVKEYREKEGSETKMTNLRCGETVVNDKTDYNNQKSLYNKIQNLRNYIRNTNFILDKSLPTNLGGGEYVSIEQYYKAIQDGCVSCGLDFSFECTNVERFDIGIFKPVTGAAQNVATVKCIFTLTDIDTGSTKNYCEISQGSDSIDKAVNGATTFAFRNWFDKNFTPNVFNGEQVKFGDETNTVTLDNINIPSETKTVEKPKVFVSNTKKEEIKQEVTSTPQQTNDKSDIEKLTSLIYEYRSLSGDDSKGAKTLQAIIDGKISDAEILSKTLSFENAIEKLKG